MLPSVVTLGCLCTTQANEPSPPEPAEKLFEILTDKRHGNQSSTMALILLSMKGQWCTSLLVLTPGYHYKAG